MGYFVMVKKNIIQGINIHSIKKEQFISICNEYLKRKEKRVIGYINANCANIAREDEEYKRIMNNFDLVLPDGTGMFIANLMKNVFPKFVNSNVTDIFSLIFDMASKQNVTFYFIGGRPSTAAKAKTNAEKQYPGINILGYSDGYFNKEEERVLFEEINKCKPDVILVGMSVPKQEKWIFQNKDRINAKILIGVGGLFDFVSGRIKRAPKWIRRLGFEWLYRFYQEPKRLWNRYMLGNFVFLYYACKDALKANRNGAR